MNLYYLIASLPMLRLGAPVPLDAAGFLAACAPAVGEPDLALLRDLVETGGASDPHPFAGRWRALDAELRNAVALQRAVRVKRPAEPWLRPLSEGIHLDIRAAVEEAFQAPSPLERERRLDGLRWRLLDELAGLDPFGSDALFAYALRLRLAARWVAFDAKAGESLLDQAVETLFEKAAETTTNTRASV